MKGDRDREARKSQPSPRRLPTVTLLSGRPTKFWPMSFTTTTFDELELGELPSGSSAL